MRKTVLLLLALSLLTTMSYAQDKTFTDHYMKLRKSEEGIQLQKFNKDDIKKMMTEFESTEHSEEEIETFNRDKNLFKNAKQVVMAFDIDEDEMVSFQKMNKLTEKYEDLFSVDLEDMFISILASSKKNKISELIAVMNMDDEARIFFDIVFEKPIKDSEWMNAVGSVSFNGVNVSDMLNGNGIDRENEGKKWRIFKEDGLYGVVDAEGDILFDAEYDEIKSFSGLSPKYLQLKQNGKIGLGKTDGDILLDVEYDEIKLIKDFSPNHFLVKQDKKYGLADKSGDLLLDVDYKKINVNKKKKQAVAVDFDGEEEVVDL